MHKALNDDKLSGDMSSEKTGGPGGPRKGGPIGREAHPPLVEDDHDRITLPEISGRLKNEQIMSAKTLAELRTIIEASQGIQREDGSIVSAETLVRIMDDLEQIARRAAQLSPDPGVTVQSYDVPLEEGLRARARALFARECFLHVVQEVQSFEMLKAALARIYLLEGGMQTHARAKIASQVEAIERAIRERDFEEAEAELVTVTRDAGLRDALKRLIQKERIPKTRVVEAIPERADGPPFHNAQSLDDVERIVRGLPGLMGSHFYKQTDLLAMVDVAKTCLGHRAFFDAATWRSATRTELLKVTSAGGFRQALERILGVA